MRSLNLLLPLLLAAGCGDPALRVLGDWNVASSTFTIQQLDFDMNVVSEEAFDAADLGTMSFVEGSTTGYGEYTFTRTLTTDIDRTGMSGGGERYVPGTGTAVSHDFDPMPVDDGEDPSIMIYDPSEPWNGEWFVTAGPTLTHTIFTEYSPEQSQLETFVFTLSPG